MASKAKEAVKYLYDSGVFEGGFDESIVKIEVYKKSVLDSNKTKEIDNDIRCDLENAGKADNTHVGKADDIKKDSTYDGLDDVKGEAAPSSVQLNSSIKSVALGALNKPKGVKGQHETKFASCLGNKRKVDKQMEEKLGKNITGKMCF